MTESRLYVIWSHEHSQWWAPDHCGYTGDIDQAGQYTEAEAADITLDHIPPGEEVAIRAHVAERHGNRGIWGIASPQESAVGK